MSGTLRIGEVAKLLGVTTKTLRHYERIGLIEPDRTESDYRVYTPEEVLRLQRIRLLQDLGLSLKQIRLILGEGENPEVWNTVLETLLDSIQTEIGALESRRERIEDLLAQGMPDALERQIEPLPDLQQIEMVLQEHLSPAQRLQWQREQRLCRYIGSREGSAEINVLRDLLLNLIEGSSDLYRRAQLFAALASMEPPAQESDDQPGPDSWPRPRIY
jgi:DNA-binding transcriptional MerR regulator